MRILGVITAVFWLVVIFNSVLHLVKGLYLDDIDMARYGAIALAISAPTAVVIIWYDNKKDN